MISAKEAKEKMPLLEEAMIQGAMWDPDAGLVIPRSQTVAGKLVDQAVASGELQAFQNTTATGLEIVDGRIKGVETSRSHIATDAVVVCAGLWGRLVAEMAEEDLPRVGAMMDTLLAEEGLLEKEASAGVNGGARG